MQLYEIFSSKIPKRLSDFHPSKSPTVTFLNPYSYTLAERSSSFFKNFDIIAPDGILVVRLLNTLKVKEFKVRRFSFDMTSVAPYVLKEAQENKYDVYFLGAKPEHIESAVLNLKKGFSDLIISGFRDGYFSNESERHKCIEAIIAKSPKIIIIGMGTVVQEKMAVDLRENGFEGAIYTCGGFLHQSSSKMVYYPDFINNLNLRLPYRMIKEEGVFIRSVKSYPKFCIKFFSKIMRQKVANLKSGFLSLFLRESKN